MLTVDQSIEAFLDAPRTSAWSPTRSSPDPVHLDPPGAQARHRARRALDRRRDDPDRDRERRRPADGRPPARVRDWLHAERPHDPRLLPLRRAAGRPDRALGTAPFDPFVRDGRMVGRGSADDEASCTCTSRPRRRSSPRAAAAVNLKFIFEGEEAFVGRAGGGSRRTGTASRRTDRHQRHGLHGGQHPGPHHLAPGHGLPSRST